MNIDRFKNNGGGVYFEEVLEKIRDIRSSEKVVNALNMHPMTMKDMKSHLTQAEKDYLEIMGEDIKKLK